MNSGSPPNLGDFDCHAAGATWAARGAGIFPVGRRGARLIERQPAVRFPRSLEHAVQGCQPAPLSIIALSLTRDCKPRKAKGATAELR